MNIGNTLFRAYCEYVFSKPIKAAMAFRETQLNYLRQSVTKILMLGVQQKIIRDENIPRLADHIIVTIDGLSVQSLGEALTEDILDAQFTVLTEMIDAIKLVEKN